jgi:DNA/RNA endonuclease YhcR with UshA esterase domain
LFFDLKDETGSVKVVLWNNSLEFLEMKNISMSRVKDGDLVNMIGNVQIYRGEIEVMPIRENVNIL